MTGRYLFNGIGSAHWETQKSLWNHGAGVSGIRYFGAWHQYLMGEVLGTRILGPSFLAGLVVRAGTCKKVFGTMVLGSAVVEEIRYFSARNQDPRGKVLGTTMTGPVL
jgi:hypothetical protein